MIISKVQFNNSDRIKLEFPYDREINDKVKTIGGAAWSWLLKAWHIPFNEDAYRQLKEVFPDVDSEEFFPLLLEKKTEPEIPVQEAEGDVTIEVLGRKIIIQVQKNQDDYKFLISLKSSRWNNDIHRWEIPDYPGNLDLIKDHFGNRIKRLIIHETFPVKLTEGSREVSRNEMLIIKTKSGRIKLIFGFNNRLSFLLKKYPYHSWDAKNKWWTIPFSEKYLEEIIELSESEGFKVIVEDEPATEMGKKRINAYDIPNYRDAPEEYVLKLREMRYSENTIRTYKGLLEEFINYYFRFELNKLDEHQIIAFLRYLVMERKVSTSYQNQAINAIKFYFEKVMGGQRKFYFIDRPRKEKVLPTVLNEEEVVRLFKCVENRKHKTILMLAYSSGLRLGEITRLKLVDIDRHRMQIRVEQSKGKKDRYTKLSVRFIKILDEYLTEYNPSEFLFEGAKGNDYSPRSIQSMIKDVAEKAKISKRVTMHTLRHTFATHSLENGVDLRYIQSMMGHESSRTTEIYTHITTKGFDQIKSPLDNLDI